MTRLIAQLNASLTWLVALPTVARWDWGFAAIITLFVVGGAFAAFLGAVAFHDGIGFWVLRREGAYQELQRDRTNLRETLRDADAEIRALVAQQAAERREYQEALAEKNVMLDSRKQRYERAEARAQELEAENDTLRQQFGRRKEDRAS